MRDKTSETSIEDNTRGLTRREILQYTGLTTLALGAGLTGKKAGAQTSPGAAAQPAAGPYNILFLLTDQERYFDPRTLPSDYRLPGRERLRREGVSFTNHQISSSVCSSSRSSIYTGQHIQHTGVFDNMGFPWSTEMSPDVPTIGDRLEAAGYYPAYLGKCHFVDRLDEVKVDGAPDVSMADLNAVMREYGFRDYAGVGDIIGMTLGGYHTDEFTTSTAVRWMRAEAPKLAAENQPWFLALNLVNPHDVMFYNTDLPGDPPVQNRKHLFDINHEPGHQRFSRQWDMALPESRREQWDKPGRPDAHDQYQRARRTLVGQFPNDDGRWKRLQDFYLNCIADCDRHVDRVLRELDSLGLTDNTIVIMTSDHGELAGAHQMHGKGATAYREQLNVPLWVRHPGHPGNAGKECQALTSHVDLAPTILSLAGIDSQQRQTLAPEMKGHDLSGLISSPQTSDPNEVRDYALYNFNMFLYLDADFMAQVFDAKTTGKDMSKMGLKPDLRKRGAIRSIHDGRYRFSRYFSPLQHNLPANMEELYEWNDVELFDCRADPQEMNNLAVDRKANGELLLALNAKLTRVIDEEVGEDTGEMLPDNDKGWVVTVIDP